MIDGYALNLGRAAQGMVKSVKNAKVACIDFNLQKTKMQMGVQVLVTDQRELERIRQEELNITIARRVKMMIDAGANVILCSKGIDDMALKYFVEAGAIACRRVPKDDLRRVAKATGAQMLTLADMEGARTFDPGVPGHVRRGVRGPRLGRRHDHPQGLRQHAGVHAVDPRRQRLHAR